MPQWQIIGTVPGQAMGSRRRSTSDLERANDMAQVESQEFQESCEPPLRLLSRSSPLHRHGLPRQLGLAGSSRPMWRSLCQPFRSAPLEPAKEAANDFDRRCRNQRPSAGLLISSQANHESEASWSPHMADRPTSPYAARRQNLSSRYRFRDSDPVVHDSAAANVAAAYNQAGGD